MYFVIELFSFQVSMQIFFRLALEVDAFSSRGENRVGRRTLKADRTIKEKALETSEGRFLEPIQCTLSQNSSVCKCLGKFSFVWPLKLKDLQSIFSWRDLKGKGEYLCFLKNFKGKKLALLGFKNFKDLNKKYSIGTKETFLMLTFPNLFS